jgi:ABC-2 type transport system permease protein
MKRTITIARKEWMHILRDPRSLIILFLMPVLMVFLFGYAVTMDVKNIPLAVWDCDNTSQSRDLVRSFVHSGYFRLQGYVEYSEAVHRAIQNRQVKAVLYIPSNYSRQQMRGTPLPVGVWVDGSDANTASVIKSYVQAILVAQSPDIVIEATSESLSSAEMLSSTSVVPNPEVSVLSSFHIRQKAFYNPELKSSHFIVPGLIAILMMMICAMLTSLAIVREKETGTFDQLLVSPIRAPELIIGKVLPYLVLAFLVAGFILAVGYWHFGVPLQGNLLLLAASLLIYLFCALALGLLISTVAQNQRIAMLMALITTLLPSVILSGFIFPIRSMPTAIQLVTYLVPAKYFLIVLRGIMLKGSSLHILWTHCAILLGMGIFLIAFSVVRFQRTMVRI